MSQLIESIKKISEEHLPYLVNIRRHLHKHPELSFRENETAKFIANELVSLGIPTFSGIAGTGVIGIIEGKKQGKIIGIRAELDALPVLEDTNLDFASVNKGVMHACGHDIHMANLLGAAKVLWSLREEIPGRVIFIFQPGEELLPGGAQAIMDSKIFREHKPDIMMGLHILPELELGKAGFRSGAYMASGDEIYIRVKGKGGHAALPHTYINPIPIASQIIVALQQKVVPDKSSNIPSVLAFGKFLASGATNVIPDEVSIEGTFRTMNEEWRKFAHAEIKRIAIEISNISGGICEVEIRKGYPSVYNNPEITERASILAKAYLGEENIVEIPVRMTTDDFAYYSAKCPSVYFRIGIMEGGKEPASLHSTKLAVNDSVLNSSIGLTAWLAINLLDKDQ